MRLEKGVMSASLVFYIPGMTEISKSGRQMLWRKGDRGTIDAIPKKDAEKDIRLRQGEDPRCQGGACKTAGGRETKRHRRLACNRKGEVRQGRDHQGGAHDDDQRPDRPGILMWLSHIQAPSNSYIEIQSNRG